MKLTIKQLMLIIMSTLLVLMIVMVAIVFNRVGGVFQMLFNSGTPTTAPSTAPSSSTPDGSTAPTLPTEPTEPTEPTDPHEHSYTIESVKAPSCTDLGYTVYTCSCGKTDIRDMKDAKGHNLGDATIIPVTCETDGYTEQYCSRCKQHIRSNIVKASHNFGNWSVAEQSVADPATYDQRVCSVCDAVELQIRGQSSPWIIRRYVPIAAGRYFLQRVFVDIADYAFDPSYELFFDVSVSNVYFAYDGMFGLIIEYDAGGQHFERALSVNTSTFITVEADGSISYTKPDTSTETPTEPTEPSESTEPTEPTVPTGPTEPTEPTDPITEPQA